jgi:hypothetical protein
MKRLSQSLFALAFIGGISLPGIAADYITHPNKPGLVYWHGDTTEKKNRFVI